MVSCVSFSKLLLRFLFRTCLRCSMSVAHIPLEGWASLVGTLRHHLLFSLRILDVVAVEERDLVSPSHDRVDVSFSDGAHPSLRCCAINAPGGVSGAIPERL